LTAELKPGLELLESGAAALEPGTTAELKPGLELFESGAAALEPGTTAELKPGLELFESGAAALEPGTKFVDEDKIFDCVGTTGVEASSPQPKITAIAVAAIMALKILFFIYPHFKTTQTSVFS
jgi:hypothetical protein